MRARLGALALFVTALTTVTACTRENSGAAAACASAGAESDGSRAVVSRYFDAVWAHKDPDAVATVFAPALVNHAAIPEAQGAEGMRTIVRKLLAAFPDGSMRVEEIVASGDRVIARVAFEGTQTGALDFAKMPLPATGKHVSVQQVHTYRVKEGRIVEAWMVQDRLDLLKQLGLAPGEKRAAAE